jgi:hypothetical protein
VAGCCEHLRVTYVSDWWPLKKDSAPWSQLSVHFNDSDVLDLPLMLGFPLKMVALRREHFEEVILVRKKYINKLDILECRYIK